MLKKYINTLNAKFSYVRYLIIFFSVYFFLDFSFQFLISATHPLGKYYSPFILKYFNILEWVRSIILFFCKGLFLIFGIDTLRVGEHGFCIVSGSRVSLNNGCLGFSVINFWIAFIVANKSKFLFKIKWLFIGVLFIFILNILRVSIILYATNKKWHSLFNIDHHTVFNIVAYGFIFFLMYLYNKNSTNQNLYDFNT